MEPQLKCLSFYGNDGACRASSPSARKPSDFTRNTEEATNVTGQANFETETRN
jgi:hypothetical protein